MRQAVRAIVIRDGALLVMHRNKFGDQYYTLVGGGVDEGEDLVTALHRELREETGVEVANPRLVFVEEPEAGDSQQHIFLCDYVSGEPQLAADSEEAMLNQQGGNTYTPMWLPLDELGEATFLSPGLRERIIRSLSQGWPPPDKPEHFTHHQV